MRWVIDGSTWAIRAPWRELRSGDKILAPHPSKPGRRVEVYLRHPDRRGDKDAIAPVRFEREFDDADETFVNESAARRKRDLPPF